MLKEATVTYPQGVPQLLKMSDAEFAEELRFLAAAKLYELGRLSSGKAAELAVSAAEAIDRELENASPDLITDIEGLGEDFRLYRCIHRKLHLDEINVILKNKGRT